MRFRPAPAYPHLIFFALFFLLTLGIILFGWGWAFYTLLGTALGSLTFTALLFLPRLWHRSRQVL
jgi:hypothetical protein